MDLKLYDICEPSDDLVMREIVREVIIVPIGASKCDADDEFYTLHHTGQDIWKKVEGQLTNKGKWPHHSLASSTRRSLNSKTTCSGLPANSRWRDSYFKGRRMKNQPTSDSSFHLLLSSFVLPGGELYLSNPGQLK